MRRVLVTGGAGFIGSTIVRSLSDDGAMVTIIDDLSAGSGQNVADVEIIELDVADEAVIDAIVAARPDVVVHAAAQISVTKSVSDPKRDEAVNIGGTRHVIEGARRSNARRVVFLSSGGAIYGESDAATEETPPAPASPYGQSKLAAEGLLRASEIPYGIARLANVYGPGQRAGIEGGVVAIFVNAALANGTVTVYGDGAQARDFVFVSDVVDAVKAMITSDLSGTWNVGTGVATTVHELLRAVERSIDREVPHDHAAARIGEVCRSRLSIDRIRTDLGWAPITPLSAGLRQTLAAARTMVAK
jgi:UDP-glucose 4-epimerase